MMSLISLPVTGDHSLDFSDHTGHCVCVALAVHPYWCTAGGKALNVSSLDSSEET